MWGECDTPHSHTFYFHLGSQGAVLDGKVAEVNGVQSDRVLE